MTSPRFPRIARSFAILASAVALWACGGTTDVGSASDASGIDSPARDSCAPLPCPSGAPWNVAKCACEAVDDGGTPPPADATAPCVSLACPTGSVKALLQGGSCACLLLVNPDATVPEEASVIALPDASPDAPQDATLDGQPDAPAFPPLDASVSFPADASGSAFDAYPPPAQDASDYFMDSGPFSYDAPYYCYYELYGCGPGYELAPGCSCVPCANTCPPGQMPGPSCSDCVACSSKCPAGFDDGSGCSCVPHGVDAGAMTSPDAADGGGVSCSLGAYSSCPAGSWCQLGTCPDGATQYGCYCNADGTSTCALTCPVQPSCTIPGQAAACPPGRSCVYGSCDGDASAELLICSCNSYGDASNAYCYTASCADGGPYLPDAGNVQDGGVTCNLEGYITCSAGSFCSLGTCQDGTTQYGCFCNQDGTATCNLACPPPPPCEIPGEGTCPYGAQCLFGCGGDAGGTGLACSCGYGGSASCNTVSCGQVGSETFDE